MSAIHERKWALAREHKIREQARIRRIAQIEDTTNQYVKKYKQILDDLVMEGLEQYMTAEFEYIRHEIHRIHSASAYEAREISIVLGQFMRTLPREAREQHRIHEEHQRLLRKEQQYEADRRIQKLQSEKEVVWQQAISNWQNKLARNLAFTALAELKKQIFEQNFSISQIEHAVAQIKQDAEQRAIKNQKNFINSIKIEAEQEQKMELVKIIEAANLPQKHSERLKQKIEQASRESLQQINLEVNEAQDKIMENEEVRKEMVKAVYQSLKQAGFTVLTPIKQLNEDGEDIVLVQACRPSGNQAKFKISLNGLVKYEFDNYKGQRCKADIQDVLPKISEIYGVNLSEERVIWENPDDEKMDAKPISPTHIKRTN